jgi:DNA-binding response OmpR family regulator
MMNEEHATLLIVEDNVDLAKLLRKLLLLQGYDVMLADRGEDALSACSFQSPDLILLDIRLEDMNGAEVLQRLNEDRMTRNIPVIFLAEKWWKNSTVRGFEVQAEDFITIPFNQNELRLRVHNALRRSRSRLSVHPITGLKQGRAVDERLDLWLNEKDWSLMVVSLRNVEIFKRVFGFRAYNQILQSVTCIFDDTLNTFQIENTFVGHITDSDFVILFPHKIQRSYQLSLRRRLQKYFRYFSEPRDSREDVFRGRNLAFQIGQLTPSNMQTRDINFLKEKLEIYCG